MSKIDREAARHSNLLWLTETSKMTGHSSYSLKRVLNRLHKLTAFCDLLKCVHPHDPSSGMLPRLLSTAAGPGTHITGGGDQGKETSEHLVADLP